jgi:ADP-heptose:LPS heptosyltransferase
VKVLGRFFKNLYIAILCLFSKPAVCEKQALKGSVPKKVLFVIADERMGELVLAGPLIREFSKIYPAAEIHLLHAARYDWLAKLLPGVKKCIPFDKRLCLKHPGEWFALKKDLKSIGYDIAIDAGKDDELSLTTAMLMGASGAQIRLGHLRKKNPYLTLAVEPLDANASESVRRCNLLSAFSGKLLNTRPQINKGRQAVTMVTLVPVGTDTLRKRVGIYPGARKHDHRIRPEVFLEVVRELDAMGCEVIVIPGTDDLHLCTWIAENSNARLSSVAKGEDFCAIVGSMDLMVANNTGPLHLSVALGVPTLGLFIAADPVRWGHNFEPHRMIDFRGADPDPAFILKVVRTMIKA